jgi:hypothetical protein
VRFLQSPSRIGAELQQKTDSTAVKVRAIKAEQVARLTAFDKEVSKLRETLEGVLNGSTPDNAIDVRALRAFLRKNGSGSGSDLQTLAQTA